VTTAAANEADEAAEAAAARRKTGQRLVWTAIVARRRTILFALSGASVYLSVVLATPLVARQAVDTLVVDGEEDRLGFFVALLLGLGVVRAASGAMRKYQATKGPALIANDLRRRLYEHFQWMSFSFHDRMGAGQLMARASTDVTSLETALGPLPWTIQSVAMFVCGVIVLAFVQPLLAAVVAVVVGAGIAYGLWRARALYPASLALQEALGDWSGFVEQQVQGVRVVKGHGFEAQFSAQGAARASTIEVAGIEFARARALFYAALLAGPGSAMLVVVGLGGWLGATGHMTPGDLLAFFQYVALLITPVIAGAELLSNWPQASAASARIAEVLAAETDIAERPHAHHLPSGPGTLRFEDVTFAYGESRTLFDHLDLVVDGGSSVALVGASGSGKTTLAFLACRFYDPRAGRVFLDGKPVDELRLDELRGAVSIVFEDTVVFTASIRENLRVGRPEASDAEIERAAVLAEADAFVRALPAGYDTVVGPQGYSLSGGQRQRLAIARAILRESRVLILDDAMSAVDPPTEAAIRRGLVEAMRGRTTLVIAHRVETISLADRVVLLDGGRVVADGTHEELLDRPEYRRALALDPVT
jgi:ATP-binding cassette, subfamily B, bacterial